MSSQFPAVNAKELVKVLQKIGFELIRQSGSSHAVYKRKEDKRRTVVPMHGKTILKRRTLKAILKDTDLSLSEFIKLLH